jgi:hypothetical protein
MPIADRAQRSTWYDAAQRLIDGFRYDADVEGCIPHGLWHWLADADIRAKDPVYAQEQTLAFMEWVAAFERGDAPDEG